ncbi:acyl-homoserine-lactone synthase [Erwinia psidii]|uniref:Acyl-homoserine-lactone synthase n=1 Tax=Erwinia psidii TaxID=69224 RepID=A0A3N6SJH7_9GAMM|nr:acyl-homoserine-lactone synthase [Erwinia psidii]MCX8958737.1 acyl-homoserine-lactone synthase [Erwinia psidii]MCX8961135.1 acyl-homoserine-lactone synthase [Erwinia psidii]MCX8966694.1 acyl-homoserine-lactone synthase [Erwinia psidii]RQM38931.1 acyl-homoserine-lactone synthase [Erwinia psidii]
MLELFDVSYEELKTTRSEELYRLRKKTFSDRLGWEVLCSQGMESDEFDGTGTRYILGLCGDKLVCSVRFTDLDRPNMITHTFNACFSTVSLPTAGIESSRFFVDKARVRALLGERFPVSQVLFLAMVNWAQHNGYGCIHTIVSRPMLTILSRSGWQFTLLKEAFLSERERIYLLKLPAGDRDQEQLARGVVARTDCVTDLLTTWPLRLPV